MLNPPIHRRFAVLLAIAAMFAASCASSGTEAVQDSTVVEADASEQPVATTAPIEAQDQAAPAETEPAADSEAASDAPAETDPDTSTPAGTDTDTETDNEPAAVVQAGTDTGPDTDAEPDAEAAEPATSTSAPTAGVAVDTTAGVLAAAWSSNVEITIGDGTFTFLSDSIPSHELPDQYLIPSGNPGDGNPTFVPTDTDTLVPAVELVREITLNPVYSEVPTDIPLGQGAVIISGAELYNDFEDMERSVVALDDQTLIDGIGFLDSCNGHPLASGLSYHYHGIPYCVSDAVDVAGQHSTVIGFMLDGFPLYANQDVGGATITSASLDECNGHFGPTPEFPDGIYHYHLTDDAAPYSINCYHGEIEVINTGPGGGGPGAGGGGGRPDGPPPEGGEGRPPRPDEGAPPEDQ